MEAAPAEPTQTSIGGYGTSTSGGSQQTDTSSDDILIWIEAGTPNSSSQVLQADSIQVLDQVNKRFKPRLLAVRVGDSVRIKNSDPVYHNVFSLSGTKRFDVGRRSPRDFQDVLFDKAGVVDVFCDIHSNMHAVIRVLPQNTVAWKKLDSEGPFRFEGIPTGKYTLHFFALGDRSTRVDLRATESQTITLDTIRLGSR